MRYVAARLLSWLDSGEAGVLVRLIGVDGSAPRELGATLLVGSDGTIAGSLSGGCVDGAVVERARALLEDPDADVVVTDFGAGSDPDFDRGLTCGGSMRLLLQVIRPDDRASLAAFAEAVDAGTAAALVTRIRGSRIAALSLDSAAQADDDRAIRLDVDAMSGEAIVVHHALPGPRLVIVGADAFAGALSEIAHLVGWKVTVVDPRAAFTTPERFPHAGTVVDWPDRYLAATGSLLGPDDSVCVLSHDDRIDVPAIVAALDTDVGYLGAMGSRATHQDRMRRLRAAGVAESALARIHSPIGLDIGARVPYETAISVVAEMVAARAGRSGAALSTTRGPIRPVRPDEQPTALRPIA